MTPRLLDVLVDPRDKSELVLEDMVRGANGRIREGYLVATDGRRYPIIDGIPRFVEQHSREDVASFGDEWNLFNYDTFDVNCVDHVVKNIFGSTEHFVTAVWSTREQAVVCKHDESPKRVLAG